jgi:hypothetical protein
MKKKRFHFVRCLEQQYQIMHEKSQYISEGNKVLLFFQLILNNDEEEHIASYF